MSLLPVYSNLCLKRFSPGFSTVLFLFIFHLTPVCFLCLMLHLQMGDESEPVTRWREGAQHLEAIVHNSFSLFCSHPWLMKYWFFICYHLFFGMQLNTQIRVLSCPGSLTCLIFESATCSPADGHSAVTSVLSSVPIGHSIQPHWGWSQGPC